MIYLNKTKERLGIKDIKEGLKFFLRFNRYILRYWKIELVILLLGNFSMVLSLVNPYIGKLILDKGILGKDIQALISFSLIAAAVSILALILSVVFDYLKNYALIKVEIDLNRDVFRRFKDYTLGQLQQRPVGESIFRIINDISSASTIINVTLVHFINAFLKIIFISTIILFINPLFLFIIFAYQLLVIVRLKLFVKAFEELRRLSLEKGENIYRILNILFSHIYLIKAFGTAAQEIKKYMHNLFEAMKLNMRSARLRALSGFLTITADRFFFGILAFYAAYLVIKGRITFGTMAAILLYISQGIEAYSSLISMAEQLILDKVSLERVASLLDQPFTISSKPEVMLRPLDLRKIEVKDVTFGYQPEKELLKDINFRIEAGSHIGLVGYSGCGKTTLLSLIIGLYKPKTGKIIVGNTDLGDIEPKYFLDRIGIALQEPFLFDDTIFNNISYALKHVSRQEIMEIISIVDASDFIYSLPKGMDSMVGENAYKISQGQKQRIAIARALIKRPQIIILDEAMSSLDPYSEAKIIDSIKSKFRDSTIILVSHRLTAIEKVDLVYFLQAPDFMLIGKHNDLIESSSEYREFFKEKEKQAEKISI